MAERNNLREEKFPDHSIPEISIIVPVYNVARYIPQALESIRKQSFTNWECIVIVDGATDNSAEICDTFAAEDARFKVVRQENLGVAAARNTGLKNINGNFISFIDPDDWCDKDFLKLLYEAIIKYDADVAQCGYTKEFKSFKHKKALANSFEIIQGKNIFFELLYDKKVPSFLWNKLFRRNVVNDFFPEGKVYEDFHTFSSWALNIRKIVVIPQILYHYRMRRGGITRNEDPTYQLDFVNAIKHRIEIVEKNLDAQIYKNEIESFAIAKYLERAKLIARSRSDISKIEPSLKILLNELAKMNEAQNNKLKPKLKKRAAIFKENPHKFIRKMRLAYLLDLHSRFCNTRAYD